MKTESEIRAHLIEKAAADESFRAQLVADPKAVVEQEFGVSVPDGMSLQVHEETDSSAHLVLPPAGGRLVPEEMQAVSGGSHVTGSSNPWG